jgi:predicted enzyme related to lactoylglutathione lyase
MASFRPIHFEIPADNPEKLTTFYSELFGWKIQKAPLPGFDYWLCDTGEGPGINGAILKKQHPQQGLINYLTVDNIDALLPKLTNLGGGVIVPRSPVPGMGWFCVAQDPQGNPIGFWQHDKNAK